MTRSFLEFVEEKNKGIISKVTLGDNNDFKPFVVSDDPNSEHYGSNSSLAPIIRAFKDGANWGWSKDDKTGEDKPVKISGKKLYLSGGAVRDHLANKKPRNIELTTNASPDETFHILKQNGFTFEGDSNLDSNSKSFWIMEKDTKGRPYKFGVRVKNDEFELSIFSGNPKGIQGEFKPANQREDAESRDFTINALSIALTNDNGPNKDLYDFFGGLHHLMGKQIEPIGDFDKKLEEDPKRALRYARMLTRYGDPANVQPKTKSIIIKHAPKMSQCDRGEICDEFSKVFNYDDCNSRDAMKIYNDLGVLNGVFPNMNLDSDLPKELKELGDKHMPLAWMMRKNMPEDVEFNLTGFNQELIKKILFLVNSLNLGENVDPETLSNLRNNYFGSGITSRNLKDWSTKIAKKDERLVDAFIQHVKSPRIQIFCSEHSDEVHDDFKELVDPNTGSLNPSKVAEQLKSLEYRNFREILKKQKPQSA